MRQAFAGMLWSKQFYNYDVATWLDGDPASRRRRRSASSTGTRAGGTSTPSTSCRCRTSGSTPGSRPGTWRSTACRSPTSTPGSPSTSSCCCAGSGSSTRTARCPPTSGTSATSTRRSRRGRRSRCSCSTGRRTSTSSPGSSTSCWSTSPGGSTGRTLRQQPVRGRLPRPGQHRPDRPLAPAARHGARAVRRHRVDGLLRAVHGHDRVDPVAQRPPHGADLVLKFLEHYAAIAGGAGRPGHVGRRGRDVLRPPLPAERRGHPGQGQVHGRHDPAARGRRRGRADGRTRAAVRQAVRRLPRAAGPGRRGEAARTGPAAPTAPSQPGERLLLSVVGVGAARTAVRGRCSTSPGSCRRTACGS